MNDKEIMEGILLTTKGVCDLYMHGSIESATPNVHEAFNTALNDSLCMQDGNRHGGIFFFQSQHLLGNGVDLFQLPVREAAKEFFNKGHW